MTKQFFHLSKHSSESFFHYYVILKHLALLESVLKMGKMRNNYMKRYKYKKFKFLMTEHEKYKKQTSHEVLKL